MSHSPEQPTLAQTPAKLIVVMGVSGSGKSTIAKILAKKFRFTFLEADDFHSKEAKQWMRDGNPLTDDMREPWITSMCQHLLEAHSLDKNCVLSYSGLRRKHRERFRELGFRTLFIFLHGNKQIIVNRMKKRKKHFMPASLVDSQYAAMEDPLDESDMHKLDIAMSLPRLIHETQKLVRNKGFSS